MGCLGQKEFFLFFIALNFFFLTIFYCSFFYRYLYFSKNEIKPSLISNNNYANILQFYLKISVFFCFLWGFIVHCNLSVLIFTSLFFLYLNMFLSEKLTVCYGYIYLFYINVFFLETIDLWNIYLLLELNSYIFIYFLCLGVKSTNTKLYQNILYFFILNFYSSLFFFITIVSLYYCYSFFFTSIISWPVISFYLFFLLKVSAGPWLLWTYNMYRGLKLEFLLIYSIIFFIVLVPKFIAILFSFEVNLSKLSFFVVIYVIYVYNVIYNIASLKLFLASSSSILLVFISFAIFNVFFFN